MFRFVLLALLGLVGGANAVVPVSSEGLGDKLGGSCDNAKELEFLFEDDAFHFVASYGFEGQQPVPQFFELTLDVSCDVTVRVETCSSVAGGATPAGVVVNLYPVGECPDETLQHEGVGLCNQDAPANADVSFSVSEITGPTTYIIEILASTAIFVDIDVTVDGTIGSCAGDPHFNRWHHDVRDTFHGECDLVFLHDEDVAGQSLTVHTRTTIEDSFSYVDAVAMKYGDDAIEFQHDAIYLNGVKVQDESEVVFGEGNKIVKVDDKKRKFVVDIQGKVAVNVASMKKFMSVSVSGSSALAGSTGILGDYETGDMIGRHGQEFDNFEDFAFEWQVNPEDPQIFMDARHPQLPYERCRMPSMSAEARRRKLRGADRKLLEAATEACVKNHIPANVQSCIDDVMFTGELELAEAF